MPRSHLAHLAQIGLSGESGNFVEPEAQGGRAYPRPMLRRQQWISLNGLWEFAIDADARWRVPDEVTFDRRIEVPFSPETRASGIGDRGLYKHCWYRRRVRLPKIDPEEQWLLHFGAVDYVCRVWINGQFAVRHEGGYTPFSADITPLLGDRDEHEIVVLAKDDPLDLAKPRGKQDWQLYPHSIWYPRTTGIWQTVWLERVPRRRIVDVRWTPILDRWEVGLDVRVLAEGNARLWLAVQLEVDGLRLVEDRYAVIAGEVHRGLALSDPGIDDFRNELLWSPSRPTLIRADLDLLDEGGRSLDSVRSYTALRSFGLDSGRLVLNGRPYQLRMVLDQGYWPECGMTAPDDDALRRDVELAKAMGFNGVRKHQKIEDPRYLYWADRLGLLVWEEMPSAYRFTRDSIQRLTREWVEVLHRDASHPCVVAWVPFNESWGVPNLPENKAERHYVETLYHLTKTLDGTRPVVGNDGWESVATDILGIHDYESRPDQIAARYATYDLLPKILRRERPGGRALVLRGESELGHEQPVVLSEFGGIALGCDGTGWGYSRCRSPNDLAKRYKELLTAVRSLELFAGFCYTQFTDTYQEANGLLYADRTPKFAIEEIAAATAGGVSTLPESDQPPADERRERDGAP